MQIFVLSIQHFKTTSLLIICLLSFHRATPTHAQTPVGRGCQIPTDTEDLTILLHPLHNLITPGTWVKDLETVHVECLARTGVSGAASLLCLNGQFNTEFPSCTAYCDGNLLKGLSTSYEFRDKHYFRQMQGSSKILLNTDLEIFCAVGYKRSNGNERQKVRCLPNGMFDVKREKCDIECGFVQPSYVDMDPKHVPWHVSIYLLYNDEYRLVCTGSVISPTLIISAAHCFWDNERLAQMPIAKYQFIAGKYKRKYNSREDGMPQVSEAESITISKTFLGNMNGYHGDVALIKLKEPLIFNENTSAVCMLDDEEDAIMGYGESDGMGAITGYAQNNSIVQVPTEILHFRRCSEDIEGLSPDKFCLIVENDYPICIGGGSGFVVKEGSTHYLSGIVSHTLPAMMEFVHGNVVTATNMRYIKRDLIEKIKSQLQEDTLLY